MNEPAAFDLADEPHAFECDRFRIVRKWGLAVQVGVCRCGRDYASAVHFGGRETTDGT